MLKLIGGEKGVWVALGETWPNLFYGLKALV